MLMLWAGLVGVILVWKSWPLSFRLSSLPSTEKGQGMERRGIMEESEMGELKIRRNGKRVYSRTEQHRTEDRAACFKSCVIFAS